jgi:hypothetical protein
LIEFSLTVDSSRSLGCRIFGRLWPVRIVGKQNAMAHQSAGHERWQIVLQLGLEDPR